MARNLLCVISVLIALNSVHSASYFYRTDRELVVPTIEDVKEVVSELKKDEAVIVEEIAGIVPNIPDNVESIVPVAEAIVKKVPENVIPIVEIVQPVGNNVVAGNTIVSNVPSENVAGEEARSKQSPSIRLDTLEVIPPGVQKSDKVQTVAETVKAAAVQAIEKQNEEVENAKPVEVVEQVAEIKDAQNVKVIDASALKLEVTPEVKPELKSDVKNEIKSELKPEVKSEVKPEVKSELKSEVKSEVKAEVKSEVKSEVKAEVKSEVESEIKADAKSEVPLALVEKKVESVDKLPEPVASNVQKEKVEESVRSVDISPAVPTSQVAQSVPAKPELGGQQVENVVNTIQKEKSEQIVEKGDVPQPTANSPERQDSGIAGQPGTPIQAFQNALTQISTAINNLNPCKIFQMINYDCYDHQINTIFYLCHLLLLYFSKIKIVRPQQAESSAASASGLNTNEVATNAAAQPTQAAISPTTASPNLVQNLLANIFPRPTANAAATNEAASVQPSQTGTRGDQAAQAAAAQSTPTTAPPPNIIANLASNVQNAINRITSIFPPPTAAPTPAGAATPAIAAANPGPNIVKGTRGDGDVVEVVQNIDIVNDKVDLGKKDH